MMTPSGDMEDNVGTSQGSSEPHQAAENLLRNELKFFFMNPIQKWEHRRKFPYKLMLQIVKIFLITIQLCVFADNRYKHVDYTWSNKMAFSHLFLKDWDTTREVKSYPPAVGPLAIYRKTDFYSSLQYAIEGYSNLTNAVGPYSHMHVSSGHILPMVLCLYYYEEIDINNITTRPSVGQKCLNISIGNEKKTKISDINFTTLIKATLDFSVKAVKYKNTGIDCFIFEISILYDNSRESGQILTSLDTNSYWINCHRKSYQQIEHSWTDTFWEKVLNYCVILVCSVSLFLCTRAIYRAQLLKQRVLRYFKVVKNEDTSIEGRLHFLNFWYILIILNDILIIIGTYLQEDIARNQYTGERWNLCSLFLGTGNLLVWFGVLRYLGFFKTYNVVMLTLKSAFPAVIRFLFVAILIYAGFVFCGWLVFGPYHMKFRSLSTTSECLFSLINGDDMFATFSIIETKSDLLYWYSRLYIYSFTSLFIYVILSLFISIIMDAYETIKQYYDEGFPKSDVEKFMEEDSSDALITEEDHDWPRRQSSFRRLFPCKMTQKSSELT